MHSILWSLQKRSWDLNAHPRNIRYHSYILVLPVHCMRMIIYFTKQPQIQHVYQKPVSNRMNSLSFSMNSIRHLRGCRRAMHFFFLIPALLLKVPALLLNCSCRESVQWFWSKQGWRPGTSALSCLPSRGTFGFRSLPEQKCYYLRHPPTLAYFYFLSSWLHKCGIIIW